ncbi:ADP-ribosylation factor-like protein 14 [Oopsacas minuta]|uniref:ADP-ribosylation factor-like protein 14 n=1 Tax=Oopsacas minuta TaxID=111878 RepID=A0AAV7KD43_9METZ|nr:ADP-ribosylation factor-like protein 14 [Oopsacas minuta]
MGKEVSKFNKKSDKVASNQNILLLGLSRSGKSTLLTKFQAGKETEYIPTEGFKLSTYPKDDKSGSCINLWDLGGSTIERLGWQFFYPVADGIIYVIDSEDKSSFEENKRQLQEILNNIKLQQVPLVILANKQDLHGAVNEVEMRRVLDLNNSYDMLCGIFGTSMSDESAIASHLHALISGMETKNNC